MRKLPFFIIILIIFGYCNSTKTGENNYSEFTFFTMDTVINVKYKGVNKSLEKKIKAEFYRIYKKFSPAVKSSVIERINNRKKNKIKLDTETKYLILKSDYFSKLSEGVFDITIKPIIDLWGFESNNKVYKIPDIAEVKNKLKLVNYKKIIITNEFLYLPPGFKLDLGGIAKGYAVDKAADIFKKHGIRDFLINAGGDLIAEGKNPKGENWVIGIKNPRGSGLIKIFSIKNSAVATSGDYQRYFIKNGVRYHHILSPFTGYPFHKWISMTVIAKTCMEADSLATMFFGMDINSINKTVKVSEYPLKYYAVNREMKIYTNFSE